MSLTLDSRLSSALRDPSSARVALNTLHAQITMCRDERALCDLLARYAVLALGKQSLDGATMRPMAASLVTLQEAVQTESRKFQTLANASTTKQEIGRNNINNMR